jgi:putative transposase
MAAYEATGETLTAMDLHKELNQLKKTEFSWMYAVSKCAPQEALRNLDAAFAQFFRRVKLKKAGKWRGKVGFPRYKARKHGVGKFRLTGTIKVFEGHIQLPRLGKLKLKERGYLPTQEVHILSATVSEQAGRWFVSVQVEEELQKPEPAQGAVVGVDLGVTNLATCSDGRVYPNPQALQQVDKRLRRLQRKLSRQQKGSHNREKTRKQLARLHFRAANLRKDSLQKATSGILAKNKPAAQRPQSVVLEDLNVGGMLQNRKLARAVADVGLSTFRFQIGYKAQWYGSQVLLADRWYPSSKTCSACGQVQADLSLSVRTYRCGNCGLIIDRDLNAARNLANLETTARSAGNQACGEDVRPGDIGQTSKKQEPNRNLWAS